MPLVLLVVALGMKGRGTIHAAFGAVVGLFLGWQLTRLAVDLADVTSELTGVLMTAPVTGVLVAIWAAAFPDTKARQSPSA